MRASFSTYLLKMDDIYSIREATPDDKQAVLQINDNVYDGLDYLPAYYDYFQSSENVTSYVSESEKIITYVACVRNDNGETMVTRAGRVSPDHQGKHVYKSFIAEVEKRQKEDGILVHHALIKSTDASESFLQFYKPVATKARHVFRYLRSNVSNKLKVLTTEYRTKAKEIDNIPAYFLSPPYSNYLFPEGRVVVDWVPFRPLRVNVPLFKGMNTVFLSDISHVEEASSQKEVNETASNQDTAHVLSEPIHGLLSACTIFKVNQLSDLSCVVDIFGNDVRSLKEHIIAHLQRFEAEGVEIINFRVATTEGSCEGSFLDDILGPLSIERLTTGIRNELIVYETEID